MMTRLPMIPWQTLSVEIQIRWLLFVLFESTFPFNSHQEQFYKQLDFILANTGSKSGIFQSIFLGKRGLAFIIISRNGVTFLYIWSWWHLHFPGKALCWEANYCHHRTSDRIYITCYDCKFSFVLVPMLCLSHVSFQQKNIISLGLKRKERKKYLLRNGVGSAMNVKIWNFQDLL